MMSELNNIKPANQQWNNPAPDAAPSIFNSPGILGNINFGSSTNKWPESAPSQPYPIPCTSTPTFSDNFIPYHQMKPVVDGPKVIMTPQLKKQLDEAGSIASPVNKHNHYFKDVSNLISIDVYRVLELFEVTDQALGHAIKKLLVAGGSGAGKSIEKDIEEAIVSLQRCLQMKREVNGKT